MGDGHNSKHLNRRGRWDRREIRRSSSSFYESAGKARGGITRQGSPWLRWMMVEAAQVATRCSPAAKRYYERLSRKKHKHVARVALARKLLIAVYVLLHDGVVFDEDKFAAV
ncbi:MAG: transposase [Terriglobales bacterium]